MFHFKKTFTALTLLLLPLLSLAQEESTDDVFHQVYKAKLSERDHFSSSGQRLKTAAAILRQDRANFHVFNIKDVEDEYDATFKDKEAREYMEKMVVSISETTEKAILNGTPIIQVEVFGDGGAEVTLITENGAIDKGLTEIKCSDVTYGTDSYFEKMEALSKKAGLSPDGNFSRYHEDVVKALCSGDTQDVTNSIDGGFVEAKDVNAISKILGISYTVKARSESGKSYGYSKEKFISMGLCSSCADNIAQFYTQKPSSPCGVLAKQALEGNPEAVSKLQESPDYCNWEYQEVAPPVQETIQSPQSEVQSVTIAPQVAQPSPAIDYGNLTDEQKKELLAVGNAQRNAKSEQRMIIFASVVIVVLTLVLIAVVLYFRKKSASKAPLESSLKEPANNKTDGVKSINELDVSESWKKKFEILERAGEFKNGSYENFKSLGFMERRKIGFNFIAFIGQPFYYFFKKMWGKGWVLFGLSVLINAAITVVEIVAKIHVPNAVYQIVPAVMFAQMANYDFYRFKVHNETMWKPFLKLNKPAAYIGFAVVSIAILLGVSALR
jgi:hypothetical protein